MLSSIRHNAHVVIAAISGTQPDCVRAVNQGARARYAWVTWQQHFLRLRFVAHLVGNDVEAAH